LKNFYFKEIKISCCDLNSAANYFLQQREVQKSTYVCVTDVGNLVNAHRKSVKLKNALNNSLMSLPDGRPLSLFAKIKGIKEIDRVAGPDFMIEIFRRTSGTNLKHFFLGDTEEILSKLILKINSDYKLQIAGSYSPDFGEWNSKTDEEIIRIINSSEPDIIWVSLGGGKQEIWMENNYLKLNKGIMTGVGAAFRFYTGEIKRAPLVFQRLGLEWFFRFIQQPEKMFKRYSSTFPYFFLYTLQEIFKNNPKLKSN